MRTAKKKRLTITVDAALVKAADAAVRAGRADSVSAYMNAALAARVEDDRRLAAMNAATEAYEAEHGKLTDEELEAQYREDRRNAVVIRGGKRVKRGGRAA